MAYTDKDLDEGVAIENLSYNNIVTAKKVARRNLNKNPLYYRVIKRYSK